MRSAARRFSSSKKRYRNSLAPSSVLEDLQYRFRHHVGLSATRKGVLLRDCQRIARMEKLALVGSSSSLHESSASLTSTAAPETSRGRGTVGGDLWRVLRSVVEFIASTGDCSDTCSPPQSGYPYLKPATKGIQRATLVLRYAEEIVFISNDRLKTIAALTFGRHRKEEVEKVGLAVTGDLNMQQEKHRQWVQDGGVDDGGPLTPLEVMSVLKWCTWHVRTALNGLQHEGPLALDELSAVVELLSRFLAVVVDGGLRRGAMETVADELALSDMIHAVTEQVLEVLHFNWGLTAINDILSSRSKATSSDGVNKRSDADCYDICIRESIQHALLCTQRERWDRALELLFKTQRWNNMIITEGATAGAANTTREKQVNDVLSSEVLDTITRAPRQVLQTLQYILAQHGKWCVCMEIWKERVLCHRRGAVSSADVLRHPFNTDNIITALAFVNAGVPSSSSFLPSSLLAATRVTTSTVLASGSSEIMEKLLQLLLGLGVIPHRALSAAEFAAVLRHSFGIPLGRGNVTGILSPSFVWRAATAHPHRVRVTLCLLCFHVVIRSGLAHTLQLEDLYVVASVTRQFLQVQLRASSRAEAATGKLHRDEKSESGVCHGRTADTEEEEEKEDGWGKCAFGLLPAAFALATRRTVIATDAHIVAITEAFFSRRRELLPAWSEVQKGKGRKNAEQLKHGVTGEGECHSQCLEHGCISRSSNGSKGRRQGSQSTILLSLVSRELMAILTMTPYVNAVGVTWQAALCTFSNEIQSGNLDRESAAAVESLAHAMVKRVLEPDGTPLLEPLVRLAKFLSPFSVSRVVQSLVGRRFTWEHCLHLLPCTPSASNVQRYLLRRILQERDVSELPWVRSVIRSAMFAPRLLLHASPTLATEMRMLVILAERDWCRALHAYTQSDSRVRRACAPHVLRLAVHRDVWHLHMLESYPDMMRSLFRMAMSTIGGERIAEEMLCTSLNHGLWATGLAFHQLLQEDQPEMLRANITMEAYAAHLCRGLLSHTALACTIAEVLKSARGAKWLKACETFIQHVVLQPREYDQHQRREGRHGRGGVDTYPNYWLSLFRVNVPMQLTHFAHTVRHSMLHTPGMWEQALQWFPPHTLPLPLHHKLQLRRLTGVWSDAELLGGETLAHNDTKDASAFAVSSTTCTLPAPLSISLVQVALQEKLRRTRTPEAKSSEEAVERTLRVLQKHGQWEQAMLVYEHALANRCFPHSAGAVVLAACLPSWEASLTCFAHLTSRMRPDLATTSLALEACAQSRQWALALRVLQQGLLTTSVPAPRVIDHAMHAVLNSGPWRVALRLARQYYSTTSPLLANTILQIFVQTKCWNDAVGFFYECVMRGMRPLDESLTLAIAASRAVSAEYRDAARVVGVIASALEDFCHVHGVLLEHVLVVCRGMSSDLLKSFPDAHLALVSLGRIDSNKDEHDSSSNSSGTRAAHGLFP